MKNQKIRNGMLKTTMALTALALLFALVATFNHSTTADELKKPSARERRIAEIVSALMQREHLAKRKIDDKVAAEAFEIYIKALDPIKVYFLKSDIDEFRTKSLKFDDEILAGKYDTSFEIFVRFLKRVDERVATAHELIDEDHDFTVDEMMVTDPDTYEYPATVEEARERWRKRIKYNLLLFKTQKKDEKNKAFDKRSPEEQLKDRYTAFAKRMRQFDNEDVIELFVKSVTKSFDPHTEYMSRPTYENFKINLGLKLEGIGATLQSTDDGLTQIKRIVPGGAADKHGELEVNDKIVSVAQDENQKPVDITWMKLDDVVKMIRGKEGTNVILGVLKTSGELKTITIVREKIELKDSAAHGEIFEAGKKADGSGFKIGVIDLPSFYASMSDDDDPGLSTSTTRDMQRILEEFNEKNVDALILDLRRNGGGSLLEAINATGLFIDKGPVVQVKDSANRVEVYDDTRRGAVWKKPMVVLTSRFSASASEILAGAVQDYNRGIVVGDTTTHGKGTVQSLVNLDRLVFRTQMSENYFGALKITLQQFYRPNGDSTQKRGVLSDIVLPSITDHMDLGEADLDHALEFDRVDAATYTKLSRANDTLKKQLRSKSTVRVDASDKFQRELRKIKVYNQQKKAKQISLNEEKFLARRKEFSAEEEDKKTLENQLTDSSEKIERDYYLEEVFNITSDYLNLLREIDKSKNAQK